MKEEQSKEKKKNWTLYIFLGLLLIGGLAYHGLLTPPSSKITTAEPKYLEVDIDELYATFSDLSPYSEVQKEDLYNREYKGKKKHLSEPIG